MPRQPLQVQELRHLAVGAVQPPVAHQPRRRGRMRGHRRFGGRRGRIGTGRARRTAPRRAPRGRCAKVEARFAAKPGAATVQRLEDARGEGRGRRPPARAAAPIAARPRPPAPSTPRRRRPAPRRPRRRPRPASSTATPIAAAASARGTAGARSRALDARLPCWRHSPPCSVPLPSCLCSLSPPRLLLSACAGRSERDRKPPRPPRRAIPSRPPTAASSISTGRWTTRSTAPPPNFYRRALGPWTRTRVRNVLRNLNEPMRRRQRAACRRGRWRPAPPSCGSR